MKKNICLISLLVLMSVSCSSVETGHEGVLQKYPLFVGHGGLVNEPVMPGLIWRSPTTNLIAEIDMRPQKFSESFTEIRTKNKEPISFTTYVLLQMVEGKSPELVSKFGSFDATYEKNIQPLYYRKIRREIQKYTMDQLIDNKNVDYNGIELPTIDIIQREIMSYINNIIIEKNIPFKSLTINSIIISEMRPPKELMLEIKESMAQSQRVKTQLNRKLAEDSRMAAEISRAKADNSYMKSMEISPTLYVELKKIEAQLDMTEKCITASNCNLLMMAGANSSGVIPQIKIGK